MEKIVAVSVAIIATCFGLLVSAAVTPVGAQGQDVRAQFSQEQQQQLAEWMTRAEQGDVGSQFALGLLLETWQASATTEETREWLAIEAADWYRRAAPFRPPAEERPDGRNHTGEGGVACVEGVRGKGTEAHRSWRASWAER